MGNTDKRLNLKAGTHIAIAFIKKWLRLKSLKITPKYKTKASEERRKAERNKKKSK